MTLKYLQLFGQSFSRYKNKMRSIEETVTTTYTLLEDFENKFTKSF